MIELPDTQTLYEFVYHSNRIEGAPTDEDSAWFTQHLAACYEVVASVIRGDRTMWPAMLHSNLFQLEDGGNLIENAGGERYVDVQVGTDVCPSHLNVHQLLRAWGAWADTLEPTEANCWRIHHAFECIHPFTDGNGRVGRLILNNFRLLANLPWLTVDYSYRNPYYGRIQDFRVYEWPALHEAWLKEA